MSYTRKELLKNISDSGYGTPSAVFGGITNTSRTNRYLRSFEENPDMEGEYILKKGLEKAWQLEV